MFLQYPSIISLSLLSHILKMVLFSKILLRGLYFALVTYLEHCNKKIHLNQTSFLKLASIYTIHNHLKGLAWQTHKTKYEKT